MRNLDKFPDIGTYWIALYALNNNVTYFDSFEVQHIPKGIRMFIDQSIVVRFIFTIQPYDPVFCRCAWIGFIDFMYAGKTLTDCTNLF